MRRGMRVTWLPRSKGPAPKQISELCSVTPNNLLPVAVHGDAASVLYEHGLRPIQADERVTRDVPHAIPVRRRSDGRVIVGQLLRDLLTQCQEVGHLRADLVGAVGDGDDDRLFHSFRTCRGRRGEVLRRGRRCRCGVANRRGIGGSTCGGLKTRLVDLAARLLQRCRQEFLLLRRGGELLEKRQVGDHFRFLPLLLLQRGGHRARGQLLMRWLGPWVSQQVLALQVQRRSRHVLRYGLGHSKRRSAGYQVVSDLLQISA